jgi:hypothetical protein
MKRFPFQLVTYHVLLVGDQYQGSHERSRW